MSGNSHDIKVLNGLVEGLIDSADGYHQAAVETSDGAWRGWFEARAAERRRLADDFKAAVRERGGSPEEDGSILAKAQRAFMDVKNALLRNDASVMEPEERGEAQLGVIRVLLGNSISADTGAALAADTVGRLADILVAGNAAPAPRALRRADLTELARAALEDGGGWYSVAAINAQARMIGAVSRDRLAADMARLLDAPFPARGGLLDKAGSLQRRYSALAGLAAEHMEIGRASCRERV